MFKKDTPLHEALENDELEKALSFIEQGQYIHIHGEDGNTPLHLAVVGEQIDIIKALLNQGAKIEAKDEDDWTPLHFLAHIGNVDIAEILFSKNPDPDVKNNNGQTPLHLAVIFKQIGFIEILLEKGANIEAKDKVGNAPLHFAAFIGNIDVAEKILEKTFRPNIRNKEGWTPLHFASFFGRAEMVECLIKNDAFVNAETNLKKWLIWVGIPSSWVILGFILWVTCLSALELFAVILVPVILVMLLTRPANFSTMAEFLEDNKVSAMASSISSDWLTILQEGKTPFRAKKTFTILTPLDVAHRGMHQAEESIKGYEEVIKILKEHGGKPYHSGLFDFLKRTKNSENGGADEPKGGAEK